MLTNFITHLTAGLLALQETTEELLPGQDVSPLQPGPQFFPPQASTTAAETDTVYLLIFWLCMVAFVIIVAGTGYFVWKYRARDGHKAEKTSTHDNVLEVTWTVIPTLLFGVMFWVGMKGYMGLKQAPGDAYPIQVTAQKWSWKFTYPNGAESPELHVPIGRPVKLTMTSLDVLHSLFIPAFRVKQDVVPGRYSMVWFDAKDDLIAEGKTVRLFDLFCTEYCGEQHSAMITKVHVHTDEAFAEWAEETANFIQNEPAYIAGGKQFLISGCNACHAIDDAAGTGPGLGALSQWIKDGGTVPVTVGGIAQDVPADDNYLRESILQSSAKLHVGYANQMPLFQGQLTEEQLSVLMIYIKSLADENYRAESTLSQLEGGDEGGEATPNDAESGN
ncbi:Cytochrome c oxidase subunit 2 precursor [Planctomycetes bacterium Pla163]|uniref:Cytochrome c oxidase subunit 2 n=1 Tax=Rohdeia mirabilis TaxID=2528008 RepID=A0A518CXV3_9BACT|nr:Cytochrome c oxidase subunit 2 precursor [Planctomycetes bacterium Pla163]